MRPKLALYRTRGALTVRGCFGARHCLKMSSPSPINIYYIHLAKLAKDNWLGINLEFWRMVTCACDL